MPFSHLAALLAAGALWLAPSMAGAEILALVNYESKPEDSLKAYKNPVQGQIRREGIAVIDVDPESDGFGQILMDLPLPADLVAHHIFFNRDATKAYVTALGKPELRVIELTRNPWRVKTVEVPGCQVLEDVVFSADNRTWYLTCMGTNKLVIGDAVADRPLRTVDSPAPYPHGVAVHDGLGRVLVSSTVRASDLGDPGETIGVLEAGSGKALGSHRVAGKDDIAPVEILFVPQAEPAVAYVTNMYGASLSAAVWNPASGDFEVSEAFDFAPHDAGVPLEIYFTEGGKRMYVTTAKPGALHVFDLDGNPAAPKLLDTIPAGEGAHHVAFTRDGRWAFVQNSLLNLPGMSEGTITVVDLNKRERVATIDTFAKNGFNPNCIVLLPEWNDPAGH